MPTSTTLAAVQADRWRPLSSHLSIHCCSPFCSAIATLDDRLQKHGTNGRVQNKTMLKCVQSHENWFRHFEDISRCELSNIAAYFFGPPCRRDLFLCTSWHSVQSVCLSVRLSVCESVLAATVSCVKRLNRSRCHLGRLTAVQRTTYYMESRCSHEKGQFWGDTSLYIGAKNPIWKRTAVWLKKSHKVIGKDEIWQVICHFLY